MPRGAEARKTNEQQSQPWSKVEKKTFEKKKTYSIDDEGNYHYAEAETMNKFAAEVKAARANGDEERAKYYETWMQLTLEETPVRVSKEDFARLNEKAKLKFYRLKVQEARINGDEEGAKKWNAARENLAKNLMAKEGAAQMMREAADRRQDNKAEQRESEKSLEERVHFDLHKEQIKDLLADVMADNKLPTEGSIYYTLSHELPKDMERKAPVGYDKFGMNFFKKFMDGVRTKATNLRDLFIELHDRHIPSDIHPQWPEGSDDDSGSKYVDSAMQFIHCHGSNKEGKHIRNVTGRFYICPKAENIVPIMEAFAAANEAQNLPFYYKFSMNPKRNDKLVIYTNKECQDKQLAILEKISQEHPEWFEGAGKNPLWGSIDGLPNIYYGAEPKASGKESYGSLRAQIFHEALMDWRQEFGITIHAKDYEERIKRENISTRQAARFKEILIQKCHAHGIDYKHFATDR